MAVVPRPALEFERPTQYRKEIVASADRVRLLIIPARRYLMIEGSAVPGSEGFRDAFAALYPVAYTLHFALKRRAVDTPVGALEGLYWIDEKRPIPPERFGAVSTGGPAWEWRLQLPVPAAADDDEVRAAIRDVGARKRPRLIDELRCESWDEAAVAQIMHIGPYANEQPTVARLHAAIRDAGLRAHGCHHEIYISDPNRTIPERLKTIIRQPVEIAA